MIRKLGAIVLLLCCGGCFQIDLYAPHGANVYLISDKKPVPTEHSGGSP